MPRVAANIAVAAKDTIASLWALAHSEGSVTIFPKSERDCYNIRNKLYAYRARERKTSAAHTGIEASALDHLKPTYGPVIKYPGIVPKDIHPDSWFLTITRDDVVDVKIARKRTFLDGPVDDFVYIAKPRE